MKKLLEIPSTDNHLIYGTLDSINDKNKSLIIFVHGLCGDQHEHQYFNAVNFFCTKG